MIFETMRRRAAPIFDEIRRSDFIRELADGTLAPDIFVFYLRQDLLYLRDYARALATVAARLSNHAERRLLLRFAVEATEAEPKLHQDYLRELGDIKKLPPPSPACFHYGNYLLNVTTTAPVAEALAALLPCFWIYCELGKELAAGAGADHPYQHWFKYYAGEAFAEPTAAFIALVNAAGSRAPSALQEKMVDAFLSASRFEYLFWHDAYLQRTWLS